MPKDPEAFADLVVMTVKAAMTPVLERLAGIDARLSQALGVETAVTTLRDRLVVVETKSALPVSVSPSGPSAAEIELTVREALEPLQKALAAAQERVAVLESRAPVPGPPGADGKDGAAGINGKDGADGLAGKDGLNGNDGSPGLNGKDGANGLDGKDVRDGLNGKDGTAGLNGKDGVDGVGFDDLLIEQNDDRGFTVKAARGDRIKEIGRVRFPVQVYKGVYVDGKTYEHGDCVTWGGSEWHCNEATSSKPGDASKAWTLKVKRGRDGRDGKDADVLPVVSLGRT